MSYVSEHLAPDEKLVLEGKIHWIGYVAPAVFFVLAWMFSRGEGDAGLYLMGIGLFLLARTVIIQRTTELAVTTKRIIAKYGLISRVTIEMQHRQIEGINVAQSALGRMLNYGSLYIRGSGGGRAPINWIVNPLEFRKAAMENIDRQQTGGGAAIIQNASNVPSLPELIAMKEKGHITEEEFAQFKKKILTQ